MYAQIIVRNDYRIVTARKIQKRSQIAFREKELKERHPHCRIEIIYENFIDGNKFKSHWGQRDRASIMDWWGSMKGTYAAKLAYEVLGIDNPMNLTKNQIHIIYNNQYK